MSQNDSESREDRLARLRDRRPSEGDDSGGTEDDSSTTDASSASGSDRETLPTDPISERIHGNFYLREDLQSILRRTRSMTENEVLMEYDIELEKNRHIRPLLLWLGVQQLQGMEPKEVIATLNDVDELDSVPVDP